MTKNTKKMLAAMKRRKKHTKRKAPPKPLRSPDDPPSFEYLAHPDVNVLRAANAAVGELRGMNAPSDRVKATREAEVALMGRLAHIARTEDPELVIKAAQGMAQFRKYEAEVEVAACEMAASHARVLAELDTIRADIAAGSGGGGEEQVKSIVLHHAMPLLAEMVDAKLAEARKSKR